MFSIDVYSSARADTPKNDRKQINPVEREPQEVRQLSQ